MEDQNSQTIHLRRSRNIIKEKIVTTYLVFNVIVGLYYGFFYQPTPLETFEDGKILRWFRRISYLLMADVGFRIWLLKYYKENSNAYQTPQNITSLQTFLDVFFFINYLSGNVMYYSSGQNIWRNWSSGHSKAMGFLFIYGYFIELKVGLLLLAFAILIVAFLILLISFCCCRNGLIHATITRQLGQAPLPRTLKDQLLKLKFDSNLFNHEKACSICLIEYQEGDEIIPLPCDRRHYFHADCISQWLDLHGDCPICKKTITKDDLQGSYMHELDPRNLPQNQNKEMQPIHYSHSLQSQQEDEEIPPDAFHFKQNKEMKILE